MVDEKDELEELAIFMAASPFYVDLDDENSTDTIILRTDTLPQNIQKVLMSEDTAKFIWNLCVTKNRMTVDQVRGVAHVMRDALTGEVSAAILHESLSQKTGASDSIITELVKEFTQKLISPNYFQISQLYERKHLEGAVQPKTPTPRQPLAGRPLESFEQKRATIAAATQPSKPATSMGDWAGEIEPEEGTTQIIANKPSKNVVDLRKSTDPLPSKLPPTPPVVTRPE